MDKNDFWSSNEPKCAATRAFGVCCFARAADNFILAVDLEELAVLLEGVLILAHGVLQHVFFPVVGASVTGKAVEDVKLATRWRRSEDHALQNY